MVFLSIIISAVAILSIWLNIRLIKNLLSVYIHLQELAFVEGVSDDIPSWAIENTYPDTTIIYHIEVVEKGSPMTQIFDTSLYLKKNVIGLTQFVQEQMLEEIAQDFQMDEAQDILEIAEDVVLPHCTVYQLKDGKWIWRGK